MGTVLQDRCVAHVVLVIVIICRVGIVVGCDAMRLPVGLISRVSGASGIGCRIQSTGVFYFAWLRANRSSSFASYW
ncbi:hypothetical protein BON95_06790 [Escherichia coli]|nr:hypothetical protein BON95_06790 [Escherichia coli]